MASGAPLLLIVWHGRMIVPVWQMRRRGIVAMVSRHQDGEMVSRLVERLGYRTVRGSSTRGGTAAALELLDDMRVGKTGAMICDGPRGPIYKMKPGTAFLAKEARATVIPVAFSAERKWQFRSWDRFQVPKPFSRVHLVWGEPIPPSAANAAVEELTSKLESVLTELTVRVDSMVPMA
ncbi:MAG TPA: lysophospholipid acyltransferase family protein [bacterium]|jgi:hypothetical protein